MDLRKLAAAFSSGARQVAASGQGMLGGGGNGGGYAGNQGQRRRDRDDNDQQADRAAFGADGLSFHPIRLAPLRARG